MPKKVKFPQKETEIAEIDGPGFDKSLVNEEFDGVFMVVTMKDGSSHTRKHQRECPWV